mmetsp:Transcript_10307/g.18573  ORF Transcript_10307/g.18573 Transcript_10307/m.18573 type:complete len:341 (-) Transcript_10307:361-1383(-)|eukprot:CAMPEP_0182448158 /NCGR_PEP_ID=MMETSP1172-20130603/24315_1 /TAXON_ID=708627 /ORGANISM="Timspurckia oligopyrenoides, Strain CCMP3278" /LENGTH=340 /DNA_ID=CAMNT_0024644919 /DNA_START=54 /DNA_END=1076 /DNA_ORIENTATION=-
MGSNKAKSRSKKQVEQMMTASSQGSDYLMTIIIENQLSRIRYLESKLDKVSREEASLRGSIHASKAERKALGRVTGVHSQDLIASPAIAQLSQSSNTQFPEDRVVDMVPSTPQLAPPAELMKRDSMFAASSPCSTYNGLTSPMNCSRDGSPGTTRYWSKDEHQRYLVARAKYGEKDFVSISKFVGTRTPRQVRTHGEKFQKKMIREQARRIAGEMAGKLVSAQVAPSLVSAGSSSVLPNAPVETEPVVSKNDFAESMAMVRMDLDQEVPDGELAEDLTEVETPAKAGFKFDVFRDYSFPLMGGVAGETIENFLDEEESGAMQVPGMMDWQEISIDETFCA